MITAVDIRAAHSRIAPHIRRTPLMRLERRALGLDLDVSLKCEFMQVTGTFKARGAFNTLLSGDVPAAGVCAASGGNHGVAVAFAAAKLGVRARIFVPEISSPAKVQRIAATGAEFVVGGAQYAEALAACLVYSTESGALNVHAYDAWPTIAGQGTVGLEWEEDALSLGSGPLGAVFVAAGGGGLVSGVAAWFDRRTRVIAVEPEGSRALDAALQAGGPVDVPVASIAADSLGARNVFARVHAICAAKLDHVALVSDAAIREAQRLLWTELRIATEPGGAAALAALLEGKAAGVSSDHVGVLVCGANVDLAALAAAI